MSDQNIRVLVVDDFETVRMLFTGCLNELGIDDVVQADDGDVALDRIHEAHAANRPFDIVFLDWNMPNKSGFEVLLELRDKPQFADLPVVIVSANSEESSVVDAIRGGVSEYIVKPFDTRTLARTLERLIRRFKASA